MRKLFYFIGCVIVFTMLAASGLCEAGSVPAWFFVVWLIVCTYLLFSLWMLAKMLDKYRRGR